MEDRDTLLDAAFSDEGLRRMTRRAGVSSAAASGSLSVNDTIRLLGDLMLRNICEKASVYADYRRNGTVTEGILRETLEFLKVKVDRYTDFSDEGFPSCETLRQKTVRARARAKREGRPKPKASRGNLAKKEIAHEQAQEDCLYLQRAPFLRLLRDILESRTAARTMLKVTPRVATWAQFVVESLLIKLLREAGELVREITKGHGEKAKSKRVAINARDIRAVADILKDCWPVLAGRLRMRAAPAEAGEGGGRGGRGGRGRGGRGGRGGGGSRGGRRGGGSGSGRGGDSSSGRGGDSGSARGSGGSRRGGGSARGRAGGRSGGGAARSSGGGSRARGSGARAKGKT